MRVKVHLTHLLFNKGQECTLGERMKKNPKQPNPDSSGLSVYFINLVIS